MLDAASLGFPFRTRRLLSPTPQSSPDSKISRHHLRDELSPLPQCPWSTQKQHYFQINVQPLVRGHVHLCPRLASFVNERSGSQDDRFLGKHSFKVFALPGDAALMEAALEPVSTMYSYPRR
jgi:hypothetical protein